MPTIIEDAATVTPKNKDGCWRWSRERYLEERNKGNIAFVQSKGVLITPDRKPAKWNVYSKIWLSDRQEDGMVPVNLITKWENRLSTKELSEINIPFDFAKPTALTPVSKKLGGKNKGRSTLFQGKNERRHKIRGFEGMDERGKK